MDKIVIIGSSGHARVISDVVAKQGSFQMVGWVDPNRSRGEVIGDHPVLGGERDLPELMSGLAVMGGIVAVGDNHLRAGLVAAIREAVPAFRFVTAVHPSAQLGRGVSIGEGSVIMAGAVVNAGSAIGRHCIVNTMAAVDHDSLLGDFASLAPGVTLGGNVQLGSHTAICLGARVIHGIRIGEHTVVGAGATVLNDLPAEVVAYGTPARAQRSRAPGERYL